MENAIEHTLANFLLNEGSGMLGGKRRKKRVTKRKVTKKKVIKRKVTKRKVTKRKTVRRGMGKILDTQLGYGDGMLGGEILGDGKFPKSYLKLLKKLKGQHKTKKEVGQLYKANKEATLSKRRATIAKKKMPKSHEKAIMKAVEKELKKEEMPKAEEKAILKAINQEIKNEGMQHQNLSALDKALQMEEAEKLAQEMSGIGRFRKRKYMTTAEHRKAKKQAKNNSWIKFLHEHDHKGPKKTRAQLSKLYKKSAFYGVKKAKKSGLGRKRRGGNNPWIEHVKDYQDTHGCSYKEALERASKTY